MVALIKELPYAAVVEDEWVSTVCSNCFTTKVDTALNRCSACRTMRYCSVTCQKADWKDHKMECGVLQRFTPLKLPAIARMTARIVMKIHRGDFGKAFNGRTINDLMDHAEDIKKDLANYAIFRNVCMLMRLFKHGQELPNDDELLSIFGKILCNSFEIADKDANKVAMGLYLGLSAHDHSCDADAFTESDGATLCLYAKPGVEYSKEIRVSYANIYKTRVERNEMLRRTYYFECSCSWCRNPEHDGWALSVCSPCCPGSACLVMEDSKELSCYNCGKINNKITVAEAKALNNELRALLPEFNKCDLKEGGYAKDRVATFMHYTEVLSPWNINVAQYIGRMTEVAYCNRQRAQFIVLAAIGAFRKYLGEKHLKIVQHYVMTGIAIGSDMKEGQDLLKEAYSIAPLSHGTGDSSESNTSFELLQRSCEKHLRDYGLI